MFNAFSSRSVDGPLVTPEPIPTTPPTDVPNRGVVDPVPAPIEQIASFGWAQTAGNLALVVLAIACTVVTVTALWWMVYAWRDTSPQRAQTPHADQSFQRDRIRGARPGRPSFSLLVWGDFGEDALTATLDSLARQKYPDVLVIAVVQRDDPAAQGVHEAARRHPGRVVVFVAARGLTRAGALNAALAEAPGEIVGVFRAGDDVHPDLLRDIEATFRQTGAAAVQGVVQAICDRRSWWSPLVSLRSTFWFRSRLPSHAASSFVPLADSAVFVRREVLSYTEGWDAQSFDPGCELGIRLAAERDRVVVATNPAYATRQAITGSFRRWVAQQSRSNQGYLQVLRDGAWRHLPTLRQRAIAAFILVMPLLQAAVVILIGGALALLVTTEMPTVVAFSAFVPLAPVLVAAAVSLVALGEFSRAFGQRVRLSDYVFVLVGAIPFQVALAFAALRALWRELRAARRREPEADVSFPSRELEAAS